MKTVWIDQNSLETLTKIIKCVIGGFDNNVKLIL